MTVLHYFSTHPELQQRIDDLHRLSQELGFSEMKAEKLALSNRSRMLDFAPLTPTYAKRSLTTEER